MSFILTFCYILCMMFALLMVTCKSPMNAVICSILVFHCVSTIYMVIGIDFLGTILIIVYVGAIAVSSLFVVMLVDLRRIGIRRGELSVLPVLILFLSFLQVFLFLEYSASTTENVHLLGLRHDYMLGQSLDDVSRRQILLSVGVSLYEYHPGLLLLAGVLLFAALVGSIYLTNYKKGFKERRQYNQLLRRKHIYTAYVSGETVIPKRILFLEKQRQKELNLSKNSVQPSGLDEKDKSDVHEGNEKTTSQTH